MDEVFKVWKEKENLPSKDFMTNIPLTNSYFNKYETENEEDILTIVSNDLPSIRKNNQSQVDFEKSYSLWIFWYVINVGLII